MPLLDLSKNRVRDTPGGLCDGDGFEKHAQFVELLDPLGAELADHPAGVVAFFENACCCARSRMSWATDRPI